VLEKNGLGPPAAIFEKYGIDSETDLHVLDQDDFSKLVSRGLKPFFAFFVTEYQRWEALALGPENGHRRHLSYNSPQNSIFLAAQGQIKQVED